MRGLSSSQINTANEEGYDGRMIQFRRKEQALHTEFLSGNKLQGNDSKKQSSKELIIQDILGRYLSCRVYECSINAFTRKMTYWLLIL
jgi:hypothetical protein